MPFTIRHIKAWVVLGTCKLQLPLKIHFRYIQALSKDGLYNSDRAHSTGRKLCYKGNMRSSQPGANSDS